MQGGEALPLSSLRRLPHQGYEQTKKVPRVLDQEVCPRIDHAAKHHEECDQYSHRVRLGILVDRSHEVAGQAVQGILGQLGPWVGLVALRTKNLDLWRLLLAIAAQRVGLPVAVQLRP